MKMLLLLKVLKVRLLQIHADPDIKRLSGTLVAGYNSVTLMLKMYDASGLDIRGQL